MPESQSDQRIASEVLEVLNHDSRLRPEGISVRVQRGIVTLSGTVARHVDRLVAAEDAWRIKGVTEVRNELQVKPDILRPAEQVAADVASALERDPRVDDRSVVVNVAEGIVRLSGTVSSEAERRAAEEDAWQTDGVVDVSNELTVSADRRRPDAEIEQDVRAALDSDARIADPTQITVKSVAGTVRLQGQVTNVEERQAAERDAWYTAGVVYVENLLTIAGRRQRPAAA
ncbi:MAG: BON domain-containing protein [Sphingomonadaceae bacterium]